MHEIPIQTNWQRGNIRHNIVNMERFQRQPREMVLDGLFLFGLLYVTFWLFPSTKKRIVSNESVPPNLQL